jgi:hypothetical protein
MKIFLISTLLAINTLYSNDIQHMKNFLDKRIDITLDTIELLLENGDYFDYEMGQMDSYYEMYEFIEFLENIKE